MNLVCIPYHDWRKISKEGSRTRDAHFLSHLSTSKEIEKLLVVNRPTTYVEIFLKKNKLKIDGDVILKKNGCYLYKTSEKVYVIDYISWDILGQVIKKKKWFLDIFGSETLKEFFHECLQILKMDQPILFTENVFSASFVEKNASFKSVFDAWDNFLLFPDNKIIEKELLMAYTSLSKNSTKWITNSKKNIDYFTREFKIDSPDLIKNGVDFEVFEKTYPKPADMLNISTPIVGFGGKISHLFDFDLFNYVVKSNPDKNFVVVGQILDRNVFDSIHKAPNFHYLGDKHYKDYPSYVCNFDVGIIPYVNNHLDSGADSIKAYEYLAASLNAVGSQGAGMGELSEFMQIAKSKEEFSSLLNSKFKTGNSQSLPTHHSWHSKTETLLNIFRNL